MSQYLLAPHVYLCVTDDHVVLLDLKRDKYLGVGRSQMRALQQSIRGWPEIRGEATASAGEPGAATESLLTKMLAAGMLTTDAAQGKEAHPVTMPRPELALGESEPPEEGDPFDTRPRIGVGHVLNFVFACVTARLALRWRPIAAVVASTSARKSRHVADRSGVDLAAARRHVSVYVYLRPLLFTAKDACLFDALSLTNFLARYGIFATWVFGVQTGPFAAHCWVQHEDVVLNDTPENVRRYAPILAI